MTSFLFVFLKCYIDRHNWSNDPDLTAQFHPFDNLLTFKSLHLRDLLRSRNFFWDVNTARFNIISFATPLVKKEHVLEDDSFLTSTSVS